jgi:hypothetical protein
MPQTAPHLMRRIFFCGAADDLTFTKKLDPSKDSKKGAWILLSIPCTFLDVTLREACVWRLRRLYVLSLD